MNGHQHKLAFSGVEKKSDICDEHLDLEIIA